MWNWGLWRSCGLSIGGEHKLLILGSLGCPEKDLSILEDGIPMWLCRHIGHILEDHLLISRRRLSRDWPRCWQRFSILRSHARHAGVYDLTLGSSSCSSSCHLACHAGCHWVGKHEGWLGLLTRLNTHL